jgi:hypothetical protein
MNWVTFWAIFVQTHRVTLLEMHIEPTSGEKKATSRLAKVLFKRPLLQDQMFPLCTELSMNTQIMEKHCKSHIFGNINNW